MTVLTPSLVFGDQPLSSTVDPRVLALLLFPSLDNAEGWIAQVISTLVEQHGGAWGMVEPLVEQTKRSQFIIHTLRSHWSHFGRILVTQCALLWSNIRQHINMTLYVSMKHIKSSEFPNN